MITKQVRKFTFLKLKNHHYTKDSGTAKYLLVYAIVTLAQNILSK